MEILRKHLDVRPVQGTTVIQVLVLSEDPREAARIANAITETYIEQTNKSDRLRTEILDRAMPGGKPVRPNIPLNISLGVAIGIVFGSLVGVLATWITSRSRPISSA